MESLLDFSAPLNMSVLDELSDSFYRDGNKAAEAALVTFQRHPMAWTRAPQILEQSTKLSARILALNILEETVRTKWSVLPVAEREGIRQYIVSLIIRLSSQPPSQSASSLGLSVSDHSLYLRKCNVVLVALVKQDWPERWPSFIPELVASSKSSSSLCLNNMAILLLLSEEVFDYSAGVLTEGKSREMKQHLSSSFTLIFTLCDDVMEQHQHIEPQLLHATLTTTLRFLHWIPVGYIFETKLCERLSTLFLPKPSCCNIAMQCLTEVAAVKLSDEQSDKYQHILLNTFGAVVKHAQQHLQQQLQSVGGHVAAQAMQSTLSRLPLAELYAETEDVQDYLRYLTLFLSSFLRTHVSLLERTADSSRGSVVVALQLLLSLSTIDEAVIFKICLEYWNWMVTMLYDNTRIHHSSGRQQVSAAQQSPFTSLLATSPAASAATSSSLLPPRLSYYAPILHDLRLVLISKMAKPEEVMIVEDENGQIVREVLKDSDSVVLYKSMREALIYLTHLNPEDTQETMLEKLQKQVDGSEWSWRNLNTVCWAIGSISGALSEQAEKNFLVKVIKDLLHFTEVKRGKVTSKPTQHSIPHNPRHVIAARTAERGCCWS